ncbi:MAG: hypothetical protein KGM47_06845, partial [Acidobacteriota bacterium]|nr:hypothetical protein [Acidobacteriota bacterium]
MTPNQSFHTDDESPTTTGATFGMAESHAEIRFHFHALRAAQSETNDSYVLDACERVGSNLNSCFRMVNKVFLIYLLVLPAMVLPAGAAFAHSQSKP